MFTVCKSKNLRLGCFIDVISSFIKHFLAKQLYEACEDSRAGGFKKEFIFLARVFASFNKVLSAIPIEYRSDDVIKIYFKNFYILTIWSESAPC